MAKFKHYDQGANFNSNSNILLCKLLGTETCIESLTENLIFWKEKLYWLGLLGWKAIVCHVKPT